jgi:hypothetical protein
VSPGHRADARRARADQLGDLSLHDLARERHRLTDHLRMLIARLLDDLVDRHPSWPAIAGLASRTPTILSAAVAEPSGSVRLRPAPRYGT